MKDSIGKAELAQMLVSAAEQIRQRAQYLSDLDSVAGDGDHGTTMLRVAERLEAAARDDASGKVSTWLRDIGWSVMGVDGGASSALLGTFFAGMGDVELEESMNCRELAQAFEAGLNAVTRQTKAQPGDKTMMDALVPAVSAIGAAAIAGRTIAEALNDGAAAARLGAEGTRDLVARYGRAKFLGEKTRGSPDAGATSVALLLSGFNSGLAAERRG